MSGRRIRIRSFIVGTVVVLLLLPAVAAGSGWLIERNRQQADVHERLSTALAYVTSRRAELQQPAVVQSFATLLDRLDLLAQLTLGTNSPPGKRQLFASPGLGSALGKSQAQRKKGARPGQAPAAAPNSRGARWADDGTHLIPVSASGARATLVLDLYSQPPSRAVRALVALASGVVVLLAGLAVALWLAGRWMVAPLARLSAQVDRVAGGDLAIAVPRSRIGEIANIADAVEGMTVALAETAQRRAEADEARRFLVTSIAHDLRTPLFALRGHLQAIGSRLGDAALHLARAEARADALERLIGNLFAYTRNDFTQPTVQLETVAVADVLHEVTSGLEHAARLGRNTFELDGDRSLVVVVDRDRVKRALTNVLDNALRYSPPGAPIHVGWAPVDETTVRIAVRDRGPGIDPALFPHVFEPGIRGAPPAGSPDGGTGLGLTIARRLLEQQHGALSAGDGPDGGAELRLTLRRAPA